MRSAWFCCPATGRLEARLSFGEALEPIVRDRLPRRCVGDICAPARSHARIAVERPHPHAHLRRVFRVAAEEVRPAFAAEALLEAAVGMAPGLHQLLPRSKRKVPPSI